MQLGTKLPGKLMTDRRHTTCTPDTGGLHRGTDPPSTPDTGACTEKTSSHDIWHQKPVVLNFMSVYSQ